MSICTVKSLDHLVLTVASISRTVSFYTSLGMRHETFTPPSSPDTTRQSLKFGDQKINLHERGKEFEPKAGNVMPGSGDLCFLVNEPVETVKQRLEEKGLRVLEGGEVVERTGARGRIRSVYVRDPDDNLVELSNYV
ncbi:Glyoxalase/Bleomycin resistance protein/Dihydroxybiphenyl dioxygenase [Naematelia encephala]|uniref:Glyoxalase/Bleomycin resistance protein/Dihydroxybiphenyl dioxygenase n=1 Tax=Naematelia encephala TaxID=71784 RepID=A0A1Y2AVB6_9TREE|nr:Glyoxalase/Bleomycin resistance protein/Dihydroxybiphenyl dioxygenase [Naematelia encephala]